MKKLNYLFGAVVMAFAMALTSCSTDDLPVPGISNGDDLSTAIANHTEAGSYLSLTLPAGVSLTMNEVIELNAPMTIKGDAAKPAKIKVGEQGRFICNGGGITLENVIIDASEQTQPLVTLGVDEPAEWEFASLSFINVDITNMKKPLTATGCKKYDFVLNIENCRMQLGADTFMFDYSKGGVAVLFNIKNSTIWSAEPTSKSLYHSQGGQKGTEYTEETIQEFNLEKSTFYNLAKSKNFFTHRQANQKFFAYTMKDCIFVNCGKSGQVVKGINQGQSGTNPIWDISGNVFNFDGTDTSADESTGDEEEPVKDSKAVVVNFADPANGDFTQKDATAGDPFWFRIN